MTGGAPAAAAAADEVRVALGAPPSGSSPGAAERGASLPESPGATERGADAGADEEPRVPYPALAATVFFCLGQTTRPRSWCLRLVCNPYPSGVRARVRARSGTPRGWSEGAAGARRPSPGAWSRRTCGWGHGPGTGKRRRPGPEPCRRLRGTWTDPKGSKVLSRRVALARSAWGAGAVGPFTGRGADVSASLPFSFFPSLPFPT